MTKKEAALKYATAGWCVFPCSANSKIPLAGTHGVKDATSDPTRIEDWWNRNPDANIGLACGAVSGVWVVDIDVRPEKGVDGFKSIRASGKTLPPTLSQNTPSGGRHCLYRCKGEKPANKNGFIPGVDIRGDGYYIVVSPSTIGDGSYSWDTSVSLLAEFPEDFKPQMTRHESVFDAVPPSCTERTTAAIDRARAYLNEIPGAIEHIDGHNKLFWVAQVLVNGFRLPDDDVEYLMWNEYNPKCVPPWSRNSSTEKEFRHKIEEAKRKPNPEAISIWDAQDISVLDASFDIDECVKDVRQLLAPKVVSKTTPIRKVDAALNDLLVPDGLVGDIAKWINETAGCYQPLFALGASLSLCGALFGRKVCDESNGRTNIFCMGVGHSSSGKDHPGDCVAKILDAAGASSLLMGRMTSDSAIENALKTTPVKLAILDEVGHFFSTINSAGDNSSYLKTIKPTLMELFSSAHKMYIGKEKANARASLINQPCMCIWGVTAPQKLYSGMTVEELQDGWIARNLIFISETRPQYVMKPTAEVPPHIVEEVKAWMARGAQSLSITADPGGMPRPYVVRMDAAARAEFERFSRMSHDKMIDANQKGQKTEYLWGKAFQNARRIALIIACGKEYEQPTIGKYEAEYGCHLVEMLLRTTEISISANVSETKFEKDKNRIRMLVEASGMSGITKTDITKKTQWLKNSAERNSYVADLLEAGLIEFVEKKNILGRKYTVFMSAKNAETFREREMGHVDAE